jgi:hypothetical protein
MRRTTWTFMPSMSATNAVSSTCGNSSTPAITLLPYVSAHSSGIERTMEEMAMFYDDQ